MSDQLTPHFSFEEMTRTDNAGLQEVNRNQAATFRTALLATAQLMEKIREWSGPLLVHSAFRCPALNGAVGGVSHSQHLLGQACDFSLCGEQTAEAVNGLFEKVREFLRAQHIPFGQLIRERWSGAGWVHISLGQPWREADKCGEVLTMDGGTYTMLEKIG